MIRDYYIHGFISKLTVNENSNSFNDVGIILELILLRDDSQRAFRNKIVFFLVYQFWIISQFQTEYTFKLKEREISETLEGHL